MSTTTNGRQRVNSRARRDSVVQRIALNIPTSEDHLNIETAYTPKLQRSNSYSGSKSFTNYQSSSNYVLYPYSEAEKQQLVNNTLDSFDFNAIPTKDEQEKLDKIKNHKYTKFLESCQFRQHNYNELIDRSTEIVDVLKDLTVKYDNVIKETYEFQSHSDALIEQHQKYVALNNELKIYLNYYEQLDSITRKLNNPSPNIVRKDSFRRMLEQLDECIEFVETHKDHKDAEPFDRRFKQCLTRALTLIRNYVINNLKIIRDSISAKLSATGSNSATHEALLYTRFASDAEYLITVSSELCQRATFSEEYEGLLNDCYNFYFDIRYRLLSKNIWDHLRSSSLETKTLVQLTQGNISYFTKIFQDEQELFFKIFTDDHKHALTKWFQQLSEPLYDTLRNSTLKEQSISALCEAATLLDKYYEYENEDDEEEEFEQQIDGNFHRIDFATIFHPILQDIQSRLVFRAQAYVHENIVNYKPSSKDFQIASRRKSETQQSTNQSSADIDDASLILSGSNETGLQGWYTPLSKGVSLLSRIYQLVSSQIFDDLAHSILHECILSVKRAFQISKQTIGSLDSDLFFLRNLLMLKNHIQTFDIEYVSNETFVDFSGIGDIINKIRNGTNVMNDGGILELVREGAPKVVSNMIDARIELTTELRNVVHAFTEDAVNQIIEPITKANTETAEQDVKTFFENVESSFPHLKNEICLFISDQSIVTTLIDGIQDLVIQRYETYYYKVQSGSPDIADIDYLITFIGGVIARIFDEAELQKIEGMVLDDDDDDLDAVVSD